MNRQRLGLWGTFAFSALAVIGVLIQVYLIGGFLFGESGWLDTHRDLGKLVHLFYVLTFVSALVAAWPDWRKTGWPFAVAALGTVQAFLAGGSGFGFACASLVRLAASAAEGDGMWILARAHDAISAR